MSNTISVNLVKDQKVDLTKSNPGLSKVAIGLGWDINNGNSGSFDLDAAIVVIGTNNEKKELVYFGKKTSNDGAIIHQGDNLTGIGDNDDETIIVDFTKLDADTEKLVVVVNIYQAVSKHQSFGMVRNAFIRIYNIETNEEILKYDLSEDASSNTGMIFGTLYRHNGEWKFESNSRGQNGDLNEIASAV